MKIILLCLVVYAMADKFDQFREFEQDEFGKTLIDTLQMQMTGEPIAKFKEIMRNLETQIEMNKKKMIKLTMIIKINAQESANLERRTVEIQSILDELEPLRSYKQEQYDVKNAWKTETEKKLAEITKKRENKKAEFDKKVEEHNYATFAIETVRRMFTKKDKVSQNSIMNHNGKKLEIISLMHQKKQKKEITSQNQLQNFMKDIKKKDYYHSQTLYNSYLSQEDQEILNNFKKRIDHQAQKSKQNRKR